jgi:hypothetical protein
MNNLVGCRELESLCRQRAVSDRAQSWKWLGEADRWSYLAHREIASRFQNHSIHASPMAMGPNTLECDSHRRVLRPSGGTLVITPKCKVALTPKDRLGG